MIVRETGKRIMHYLRRVSVGMENVWYSPGALSNPNKALGWRRAAAGVLKAIDFFPLSAVKPDGNFLAAQRARLMGEEGLPAKEYVAIENKFGAHNYHPLDVIIARGQGVWVWDVEGRKYLDCLSAYSALNFGYGHPRILEVVRRQAGSVTLTSRAFRNRELPLFAKELCELTGYEMVLPMNSGAEGVETALKIARKWGYLVKGIPQDKAEIITCSNNFHGRTVTVISFSTESLYRADFGPFTPGFVTVPFGDIDTLEKSINSHTAAFLVEPIQAEAGIIVPPEGYLAKAKELCAKYNVLFIADEIQTGLGRTGKLLASDHAGVRPDVVIIGKSLGGGAYPISAVLSSRNIMGLIRSGQHGSTFGGNPLACAIAREALKIIVEEQMSERAQEQGEYFMRQLRTLRSHHIKEIRGKGLLIGLELYPEAGGARRFCEALAEAGILCKETHDNVIRFAPPLNITREEIDWAFAGIEEVFESLSIKRSTCYENQ